MDDSIVELLNLGGFSDFHLSGSVWLANRRQDVAPKAYDVRVHVPPSSKDVNSIVDYASPADANCVRKLFSLCNGLHVGASRFAVFGLIGLTDDETDRSNAPFDINIPNIHERPKSWPNEPLIVGVSRTRNQKGTYAKFFHSILPTGSIHVSKSEDFGSVTRQYEDVESWLKKEVEIALNEKSFF